MRVIVRGFLGGVKQFEDGPLEVAAIDQVLAESHVNRVLDESCDMLEIEFPDEPEAERFYRMGTNPKLMRMPISLTDWMRGGQVD